MKNHHTENEYIARINRTFDYIETNIEKQFTLEELANVAHFSKFHFNRVFKALVVYHDDPSISREDKLRISVCFTVPSDTKVEGEIGKMQIESGKYVIARFELTVNDFQQAWDWVYGQWFPASGYQPDDKPCFEMYTEEPQNGIIKLDICVPVKPL